MAKKRKLSGTSHFIDKKSSSDDDWEDEGTTEESVTVPKSSSEPVWSGTTSPESILSKLSRRNVKTIVHELKRQSAFDKVLGKSSTASVAQERSLRSRTTKSKNVVNIRDLPLPPEDKGDDQSDYDPEAESASASADEESESDEAETACTETDLETETGSTAPDTPMLTPIHEQGQTVVTRARDQGGLKSIERFCFNI